METSQEKKQAIRDWWASYPMTYGREHGSAVFTLEDGRSVQVAFGSRDFFVLADKTFYQWNLPHHSEKGYFSRLFPYERFAGKAVLEVGCGMGCMAMNWAQQGALVTAVDLNPVSVRLTRQRFDAFQLSGIVQQADAESLPFREAGFDYVYSWGVLHHTPNIRQAIRELFRVLKPGGSAGVMLYHRNSVLYRFLTEYIEGFLNMERRFLSPLELASRYADGGREEGNPHTWPVTRKEVFQDLFTDFQDVRIRTLGTDLPHVFELWFPGLAQKFPSGWMDALARRFGWSLWITGEKKQ